MDTVSTVISIHSFKGEKGRDLTHTYVKSPFTSRKSKKRKGLISVNYKTNDHSVEQSIKYYRIINS